MKSIGWIVLGCVVALAAIGGASTAINGLMNAGSSVGASSSSVFDGGIAVLLAFGARGCFRRASAARTS